MDRLKFDAATGERLAVSSRPSVEQSRQGSSIFSLLLILVFASGLAALVYFLALALGPSETGSIGALSIWGPILFTVVGLAVATLRSAPRFRHLSLEDGRLVLETLELRRLSRTPAVVEHREFEPAHIGLRIDDDPRGRPYLEIHRDGTRLGAFGDIAASRLSDDSELERYRSELQTVVDRLDTRRPSGDPDGV
jgi:hypothetical protein